MEKPRLRFKWGPDSLLIRDLVDWPVSWGLLGLVLGIGLGVTTASIWLMALAILAFIANMYRHKKVGKYEGRLLAAAPFLLVGWVIGFVIRGIFL